ncbi:unnamed protein product, partial [Hapterophycus canaliculatus]
PSLYPVHAPTNTARAQEMLCEKTRVLAKRQKLVGLSVGGRPAADDCPLERIRLKTPHRFILMGTPEVRRLHRSC